MKKYQLGVVVAVGAAIGAVQANAGLIGQTVGVEYDLPNLGTAFAGPTNFLVGAGVELNCPTNSPGLCSALTPAYSIDLSDTQIAFNQSGNLSPYTTFNFNGWVFTNLNMGSPITGFTLVENGIPGLTNSAVAFTANSLSINLEGDAVTNTNSWTITLQTGAVPEPSTMALLGAGLAGVIASSWRRKRRV